MVPRSDLNYLPSIPESPNCSILRIDHLRTASDFRPQLHVVAYEPLCGFPKPSGVHCRSPHTSISSCWEATSDLKHHVLDMPGLHVNERSRSRFLNLIIGVDHGMSAVCGSSGCQDIVRFGGIQRTQANQRTMISV